MTLLVIAFTLTFVSEFQNLTFTKPRISHVAMNMCSVTCDEQCEGTCAQCRTSPMSEAFDHQPVMQSLSKNDVLCDHSATTTSFIVDATQCEDERHRCLTSFEV